MLAASLIALTIANPPLSAGQQPLQTPTFRSATTLVSVDVSVQRGNASVAGLVSADFALTDNGVLQSIDAVSIDAVAVPVDVTLVVDTSGSTSDSISQFRADVLSIAQLLRPIDRLRLIAFDSRVKQLFALQPAGAAVPVELLTTGNLSSVFDGVAAALLRQPDLDRRGLIVAFTDGIDNRSILLPEQLLAVAKRAETVLHAVGLADYPGLTPYTQVAPSSQLRAVIEATGGAAHAGSLWSGSAVGDFKKIFEEFRHSYVLQFHPTGVPLNGWHDLTVKITRPGSYNVKARKGYFGG